ncbi:MAG TPA: AmmeMemoRadiSam system protein B [Nitrospirales bacterium]
MTRPPAHAGSFYDASAKGLHQQVQSLLEPQANSVSAIAIVCPHAGLMYSGKVAGAVYSRVSFPRTAILVGPNHTGHGSPLSVYAKGDWAVPGGLVPIVEDLAQNFLAACVDAAADYLAHQYEHCLEVQLPFLLARRPDIQILPILVGVRDLRSCLALGRALAAVAKAREEPPILIASTDMTHCGPGFGQSPPAGLTADAFARRQDRVALDVLKTLDEQMFHRTVERENITMCGYGATTAVLHAARLLRAQNLDVIRYATSAEISGDLNRVVGYAGVVIS